MIGAKERGMKTIGLLALLAAGSSLLASATGAQANASTGGAGVRASIQVQVAGFSKSAEVVRGDDGRLYFELRGEDGRRLRLAPDELAERLSSESAMRPWWARLLNISSVRSLGWVVLGFLGQLLFTGRMVVQWVMSERRRQSVVPTMFWWLSLAGATLLLAYFGWRRDIIGVMGQAFGWVVYVRNLHLLGRTARQDRAAAA